MWKRRRSKRSLTSSLVILTAIISSYNSSSPPSSCCVHASTRGPPIRRSTLPFTSIENNGIALKSKLRNSHVNINLNKKKGKHQKKQQRGIKKRDDDEALIYDNYHEELGSQYGYKTSFKKKRGKINASVRTTDTFNINSKASKNKNEHEFKNRFETIHQEDMYSNYKTQNSSNTCTRKSHALLEDHDDFESSSSQQQKQKQHSQLLSGDHIMETKTKKNFSQTSNNYATGKNSATPTTSSTSTPLLQIPLSLILQHQSSSLQHHTTPIKTFLDTGAQVTIITFETAKKSGVAHLIDTRYEGHACGVAGVSCKVIGRIPARTVSFVLQTDDGEVVTIENTPAITVLKDRILGGTGANSTGNGGVDMLLGLDVLEEWKATLCLYDRTLKLRDGIIHTASGSERDSVIVPLSPSSGLLRNNGMGNGIGRGAGRESKRSELSKRSMSNDDLLAPTIDEIRNQSSLQSSSTSSSQSINSSANAIHDEEYDEEEEYLDDNYYFVDSEEEFDECDLSGV